jgi:hypothetical protein
LTFETAVRAALSVGPIRKRGKKNQKNREE